MVPLIWTPLRNCKSFTYTLCLYSHMLCELILKVKQDIFLYMLASKLSCYKHNFLLPSMSLMIYKIKKSDQLGKLLSSGYKLQAFTYFY